MTTTLFRPNPCSQCEDCLLCEGANRQPEDDRIKAVVREAVIRVLESQEPALSGFELSVGVSARHLHITSEDLQEIYGPGHQLTPIRDLTGPGEFAAQETVTIVGPNMRAIQSVRILGPCRNLTQVELAPTDGVYLSLPLPLRASGDLTNTTPITIVGPQGALNLKQGAIRADRHIHIDPKLAVRYGVTDGQRIRVDVPGPSGLTFHHVRIRFNDGFDPPEMHIDTDDGNAAGLRCGDMVRALTE